MCVAAPLAGFSYVVWRCHHRRVADDHLLKPAQDLTHSFLSPAGTTIKAPLTCVLPRLAGHDFDVTIAEALTASSPRSHRPCLFVLQNAYATIKGVMTCVTAPPLMGHDFGFTVAEPLTTISWGAPRAVEAAKQAAVIAALNADAGKVPTATDPYFFGKQVCLYTALFAETAGTSTANPRRQCSRR